MATATQTKDGVVSLQRDEMKAAEPMWRMTLRRFRRHKMAVFGIFLLLVVISWVVGGSFFVSEDFANEPNPDNRFGPPTNINPFGTDQVGRDVLARTIYGGQISLLVGIFAIALALTMGTVVGLLAGYFAGTKANWIDAILMRIVEAMLAFPTLILLLLLSPIVIRIQGEIWFFGRTLSPSVVAIVLLIGLTGWMGLSRVVRSLVLSLKERDFVLAARTLGATDMQIIFKHILPNCLAPILVTATLGIGGAIVTESALSFLGFGVQPPTATWGNILERVRDAFNVAWWLWVFPGLFIVLTVLSINFIGDGLRDAFDPRSQK
jgi:peptide/nickel transport system permease protein